MSRKLTSYLLIFSLLLLFGCKDKVKPGTAEVKRQAVTGVTLAEVHPTQVDEYYETSGTVRAKTISVIASRVMGTVTSVKVKEGDRVHAGQVLMTIDDRDVAQRVKAAEKTVEAAKQNKSLMDITYRRYKNLHDEKAISQQEIDQIETQKKVSDMEYERAKAMLAEAQIYHGFTRISAPTSGVVTEKKIELGSMAVPGIPILTVEDNSYFRIEANVDERLSGKLKIGMPVDVIIDSIGQEAKGRITEIIPAVDPMSRTFLIKIDLKMPSLKTGLYGKVLIPEGKREAILVPQKAIVEKGQLVGVYVVDDKGVITYRLIKAGKKYGEQIEVLSGLNGGEKIIVDGVEKAVDGGIIK
ncbi:MAG: efflux RND transporter periplasmic adaptor subunit [Nitrospiraceae bacterium]|jgi:RND family efflux transporter MFP subunit|nr:efflux RND transporter periplasmic adaptor subunit [Nitrospirota bacterium]MDA8338743.1 efflux RND transporter periplasmic adaptor subunit [Nitrospiraceae bacterium]